MAHQARFAGTLLLAVGALVAAPTTGAAESSDVPVCVHARAEARYIGFAYDHFVHIRNDCKQTAACTVTTNINPDPIDVRVAAGRTRSVLTYRASPAREFTYTLRCSLDGG